MKKRIGKNFGLLPWYGVDNLASRIFNRLRCDCGRTGKKPSFSGGCNRNGERLYLCQEQTGR